MLRCLCVTDNFSATAEAFARSHRLFAEADLATYAMNQVGLQQASSYLHMHAYVPSPLFLDGTAAG